MPDDIDPTTRKRADSARNERLLLDAAASVFVESGVDAPVREIAARAGVGIGTVYRHFPTRAELVIAVYRHQIEALEKSGATLSSTSPTRYDALVGWVRGFVDFLATKHGLVAVMRDDSEGFNALHRLFLTRLEPVCADLVARAVETREIRSDVGAYDLMRAVGNLCAGARHDDRYRPELMVELLLTGLRVPLAHTKPSTNT